MKNETQTRGARTAARFVAEGRILILLLLACASIGCQQGQEGRGETVPPAETDASAANGETSQENIAGSRQDASKEEDASSNGIPQLVDLGAGKCIPCKMMAPILEELKSEYQGKLEVVFIDVWEDPNAGQAFGISMIPTQIFYDASGKELFRHEGFFSKEEILEKWKEFGVELEGSKQQN